MEYIAPSAGGSQIYHLGVKYVRQNRNIALVQIMVFYT